MLLQLVRDANRWYEMTPCPRPETIAAARAARQAEARRAERVKTLVAAMPAELKRQVLELVKVGRRLDATKHYQAASGEDLTTSVEVLELLAPDDR
jgi:prolyl-tRNA editing enzyme YbaK/EbsC (Cys-tRNA(Pro) deacylase)